MATALFRQIWTSLAVLINMFGLGLMLSYPTSLLPALTHPDSDIKADLHDSSWLGSIPSLAGIPGFVIFPLLMAVYGRKTTHGLLFLPAIFGLLMIYFARDITLLMIGRFLCGLSAIPAVSLGAIIIGEYTSPKYRGVMLNLKNVSVCLGVTFMHMISSFWHWRTIAAINLIPHIIALLITLTWRESPAWLASKHQYEESQEVFYWLMGKTDASQREIEEIINVQKEKLSKTEIKLEWRDKFMGFFRKYTQKDFLKPSLIMMVATTILEMSGRHVFPPYALHIMSDITGETFESFYYTLGIDIIITTSAIFASVCVKVMNRRTLLFVSGFAAMAALFSFCTYLFLASKDIIPFTQPWIPNGLLISYFILANLGCAPVPLVLIGEIYPLAHREVGSALAGIWLSICLLAALKSAPHLIISIRVYGFFAVYAIILGICLWILYFIMPETKDRTLQEIENYFKYGKFRLTVDDDRVSSTATVETVTI